MVALKPFAATGSHVLSGTFPRGKSASGPQYNLSYSLGCLHSLML